MAALVLAALLAFGGSVAIEEGATFNGDGSCVEADGTVGVSTLWGECVTPADYDATFSADELAQVESQASPGRSVADVYGVVADDVPSERVLGSGFGATFTFDEYVVRLASGLAAL